MKYGKPRGNLRGVLLYYILYGYVHGGYTCLMCHNEKEGAAGFSGALVV